MKLDNSGKRIIFLRNLSGLTRKEFEEKYNIPIMTLRTWEMSVNIKNKAAKRFLSAIEQEGIKCSLNWIISGKEPFPSIDNSLSTLSEELNSLGNDFDEDLSEEILFLQKKYKNSFTAILINDDANFPLLCIGDYIGGVSNEYIDKLINQLCIIENDKGIVLVRQLIAAKDHGEYHLKALNQDIEYPILYNQKIKKAWKIIWIRKRP